jgi:dTDP-4-dehydrorhamnose 3,5-epimerase
VTVQTTSIDGVLIIDHPLHADARGFFHQTSVLSELSDALGQAPSFVQSNHARSMPGVLRGIHAEPWAKLVYVAAGQARAVMVDLRPDSPTFATHLSILLGDGTDRPRIYVPEGVGNAYCVVGDQPADYLYDVTGLWSPGVDPRTVRWDDPTLGIDWPVSDPILSDADRTAPTLATRFADHPMFTGT